LSNANPTKTEGERRCSGRVNSSGNKSWRRKGPGSVYDKWNIFVVICDTYSIAVNQGMVAIVKYLKWWLQPYQEEPWFSSFIVSSKPLSRKHNLWNTLLEVSKFQFVIFSKNFLVSNDGEGKVFIIFFLWNFW
jgi:hypothetical protein